MRDLGKVGAEGTRGNVFGDGEGMRGPKVEGRRGVGVKRDGRAIMPEA